MPTAHGGETIGERLLRKREELTRVRAAKARSLTNGAEFNLGGAMVTQIGFEQIGAEETKLESEIRSLEARIAGAGLPTGLAHTQTRVA